MIAYLDGNHWRTEQISNELIESVQQLKELQLIAQLNPKFSKDGNQFCFLYGKDLHDGVAGFGSTVGAAASDFWHNFHNQKA